jgi:hypothetical protein
LLRTQDPERVERARLDILDFIFSSPRVPPDEEQIAPTLTRLAPEMAKTFDWAHVFHRSLYDLFASRVADQEAAYRKLLADYLEKPESITPHRLDHHEALWSFPESKSFRGRFPKFAPSGVRMARTIPRYWSAACMVHGALGYRRPYRGGSRYAVDVRK